MKFSSVTFLLAGFVLACAPASPAVAAASGPSASAPRGSVTGRVQNLVTGKFLNNARVSIKGADLLTLTDSSGTFLLVDVPTGPAVLQVFYTDMDLREIG